MTTPSRSALELRVLIGNLYLCEDPPPGIQRANLLIVNLRRAPTNPRTLTMARDLLAVVDLRARLRVAVDAARATGDQVGALVLLGLLGHADAELMGSTDRPGWRAAALDLLEPDGEAPGPLDPELATRLLALVLVDDHEAKAGD